MVNRFVAVANIGAAAMAAFILHGCGKEKEEVPEPTEEEIDKKNGDEVAVKNGKRQGGHTRAEDDKKKGKGKGTDKRGVDLEDDENRKGGADCSKEGDQEEQNTFCRKTDPTYWCNNGECMPQHVKHKMTREEIDKQTKENLAKNGDQSDPDKQDTQKLQAMKAKGNNQLAFDGESDFRKSTTGVSSKITSVTPSSGKK